MIIDQTFRNSEYNDNPNVKIRMYRGTAFVSCRGMGVPGESCKKTESIIVARIDEGVDVCALARMYSHGEIYAGKIWADFGCGPFAIQNMGE